MRTKQTARRQRRVMAERNAENAIVVDTRRRDEAEQNSMEELLAVHHVASFQEKLEAACDLATVQSLIEEARRQCEELQREFVRNALRKLYNFEPRRGQVHGVWQMIFA